MFTNGLKIGLPWWRQFMEWKHTDSLVKKNCQHLRQYTPYLLNDPNMWHKAKMV